MPPLACVDTAVAVPPSAAPGYASRPWDFATIPGPEMPFPFGGTPPTAAAAVIAAAVAAAASSSANSTITTPTLQQPAAPWSVDRSAELYGVDGWGAPYFSVNSSGNISVRPHGSETLPHQEIDLMKVVKKASDPKPSGGLGLQLPLIVRFPDVLRHRLNSLQSAFDHAIRSSGYGNRYQGVYPVKCNQDRYIVEDVVEFGSPFRFGLEAGSKPELLLAMNCLVAKGGAGTSDAFIVCNGYKDQEYVSLALMARKMMDLNTVIVLEQEEELDTVIDASRKLGVRPVIGLRAKLRTKHSGHFGSTSGEKGKFGLNTLQVLSVARRLQKHDMLDCLQLLHFHIGSQIPSTSLLADGVGEAAQIYCELAKLGAAMKVIDIGGGLGIDYDGSRSGGTDMSVGYSLDEYASTVVNAVRYACDSKLVTHPIICSESGRALVSHHSVLVFDVVSSSSPSAVMDPAADAASLRDLAYLVETLGEEAGNLMASAVRGDYEACRICIDLLKRRSVEQFKDGSLGLEHLAAVDGLCDLVSNVMKAVSSPASPLHDPVSATYHVNLSLFTSIPDFWAIGQLFPVLPIHRLDQRPSVKGVLSDLTCDSDGKMDRFIGGKASLPLHEMTKGNGRGYYLGMFLGGAYQEALGGLHNLFGGSSVVRVSQSDGPHCFAVTRAVPGPSCADVLRAMQHEPEVMFEALKQRADECAVGGADGVACGLARAFNSMPYLVASAAATVESGMEEDVDDDVYHNCVSGEEDDSGGDGASFDDLEWDLSRCMLE